MSGKAAIGKGKGKGKKKEGGEEAVKGVAIATGVKWSGDKKPTADSQYRRSELGRNAHFFVQSSLAQLLVGVIFSFQYS